MSPKQMQEAFDEFHTENPHVYDQLVKIASFVIENGKSRYGIAAIFERLRWVSEFETEGDHYKLNNNFKAYYARMLMRVPQFSGLFNIRRSKQDEVTSGTN